MGKRSRKRTVVATTDYTDDDGNVLTLRDSISAGSEAELERRSGGAAASVDDHWHRAQEQRFERYAVRWVIAGLPLEKQKELLARYRMADTATQDWVQRTIDRHIDPA